MALSHVPSHLDQEESKVMQYREKCGELKSRLVQVGIGTLKTNYNQASLVLKNECRDQSIKLEVKVKK